jgi:hypothetical protein
MTIVNSPPSVCADSEISLPILVRLPDVENVAEPTAIGEKVAPEEDEPETEEGSTALESQPRVQPKTGKKNPRLKRLKSQIAMVLVALAFVVLLAMLVLHRKPDNDKGPEDPWPTVADDGAASVTSVETDDVESSLPKRLPPVGALSRGTDEASLSSGGTGNTAGTEATRAAQEEITLHAPSNAPGDGDDHSADDLPGVAKLTGTIEPDNAQAGNNQHSTGRYR